MLQVRDVCPACLMASARVIYRCLYSDSPIQPYLQRYYEGRVERDYLHESEYVLVRCDHCRLIYQKYVPSDALLSRIYDNWIRDVPNASVRAIWRSGDNWYAYYFQEITTIIALLRRDPWDLKFLDFGMGYGEWCRVALAYDINVQGSELSVSRLEHAESHGVRTIPWNDIPGQSFDFINSEQVFEHLTEPLSALKHLTSGLKLNGIIKISVPNGQGVERRLHSANWDAPNGSRRNLHCVHPLEHINCFRHESLVKMAALAGLQPVSVPLRTQYLDSMMWTSPRRLVRNLVRPLYRDVLHGGTYMLFRRKQR